VKRHYTFTSLGAALRENWRGFYLSRKADGVTMRTQWNGAVVWGDRMPDGRLMVWEIERAGGRDVSREPWPVRQAALREVFAHLSPRLNWQLCAAGAGVEFIEAMAELAVRENTPDVVVAKPFDAPFGVGLVKVKTAETHDCVVAEVHPVKSSLRLVQLDEAGQVIERGWCPVADPSGMAWARTRRVDAIAVGSVVEVVAANIHRSGKFREVRFVRARPDKVGRWFDRAR
jgi:ATP-dependent DNA ligase